MPNITFSLPERLYTRMRQFPWVKWSEIARQSFETKLKELETMPREPRAWGYPVRPGRVTKKVFRWIPYPADEPAAASKGAAR